STDGRHRCTTRSAAGYSWRGATAVHAADGPIGRIGRVKISAGTVQCDARWGWRDAYGRCFILTDAPAPLRGDSQRGNDMYRFHLKVVGFRISTVDISGSERVQHRLFVVGRVPADLRRGGVRCIDWRN